MSAPDAELGHVPAHVQRRRVAGCLAVVVLDVILDETRAEDAAFFVVLAVVMVGLAALARWVTRRSFSGGGGLPSQPSPVDAAVAVRRSMTHN